MEIDYVALKNLLSFTRDGEWGKGEPGEHLVEMRVIRGTDFEAVRLGDLANVPTRFVREDIAKRKQLQPKDILIETAGGSPDRPTGRTLFLPDKILERFHTPVTCASFSRFLRVAPTLAEPEYVFWYLQYLYHVGEMEKHQVQHTGVARFQYTNFAETVDIALPPLEEQRTIAHILGTLDDKIELNRRMNETLEATARAIFKSWFVDFDPVHAKANGEQPFGMDADTAALFPDSFEDSELGPIPAGWRVGKIEETATLSRDSITPDQYSDELFYHYSFPAYVEGKIPAIDAGIDLKSNKYLVPDGCVLLAKLNPRFPKVWLPLPMFEFRPICSTEFLVVMPRPPFSTEFLYSLFFTDEFLAEFSNLVTGTSTSHQRVKPDYYTSA